MSERASHSRRGLIRKGTAAVAGLLLVAGRPGAGAEAKGREEEVSPAEDLMREHGVLKRILLIDGEFIRRLQANEDVPLPALKDSTAIIGSFIQDYHEKLEENYLFPRFARAKKMVDLVNVLFKQHMVGRGLTATTVRLSTAEALRRPEDRAALADSLRQLIRMYDPHAAREDTVLFPAFRGIVSQNEYDALGEDFEHKEHELFGEDGFHGVVERVAAIEKSLGIHDLAQFTPKE